MDRKLQVFISSTYSDLTDERQAAVQAVLLAKHIPAGMELFSAGDATQLQVIKNWIEESDVYLLILGGRYGSIEPVSGRSYTEVEYDYAVSLGKPFFAVVLNEAALTRKREQNLITSEDDSNAGPLTRFKTKVLSKSSRIVDSPSGIQISVLQSLADIEKRPGLIGWVRPSDDDKTAVKLLSEINDTLRSDIERAKGELAAQQQRKAESPPPAGLEEGVVITVKMRLKGYSQWTDKVVQTTWGSVFGIIAIKLLAPANDEGLNRKVSIELGGFNTELSDAEYKVQAKDWEMIQAQLLRLKFVSIDYGQTVMKTGALFWTLTPLGKEVGLVLRSVPSKSAR